MFVKLTRSRGLTYAQLVESFRDEHGTPRQRTVATLGRVDESGGQLDAVLAALLRARGHGPRDVSVPQVSFEPALALGDVWALHQLWHELGFDALAGVFRRTGYTSPVEHALRAMVFNRLCDPDSKLGVLRWLETVSLPGIAAGTLSHQQLLRSMDALMDHQPAVDEAVAHLLRPLIDVELAVAFYDLTTVRAEGLSQQEGDVRQMGRSKEGGTARQFVLALVQTAEGLPLHHEVLPGNTAEAPTLLPMLKRLLQRYPHLRRLIVVADRGLLSLDNLDELAALKLPGERTLEYILAVPGRRYGEFTEVLEPLQARMAAATDEVIDEVHWQGRRLVVAHDPQQAQQQTQARRERIAALTKRGQQLADKLDEQDAGASSRGRKLTDGGARARFFHEVCDARLSTIVKVDLQAQRFTFSLDDGAQARAEAMDGKLALVTNVAAEDLAAAQVVQRYKSLADIERGFRVLKSDLQIAPVFHRLPQRIKAHASLCFLALILHRVMRQRLRQAASPCSPDAALTLLRRVQRHAVSINGAAPIGGVSPLSPAQAAVLAALNIKKPIAQTQMNLL
jgi:uncharacterized protein YmfQ (DUF2313 family)